jgi:peroxiredoxin Q/BCP
VTDVRTGDRAPHFRKTAHDGTVVEVGDDALDRVLVLYFYPKDETPGCTAQACSFRDNYEDFLDAGAQVVGVSMDTAEGHESFASNHRLPFPLIADTDRSLAKAFGVSKTLGLLPGRVTYVIDRSGIVRMVFESQIRARKHVEEALDMVRKLAPRSREDVA